MIRPWLFSLALAAAGLAQQTHGGDRHLHHVPKSAEEYAKILEDPQRDTWQKPHEVVIALDLKPTDTVADIGAGSGYFAVRFARHADRVLAVDIDPKLLEMVTKRAGEQKLTNLETVLAAADDPHLRPESVDVIFICDVIHHIEKRNAYYQLLARALKPGGRLVIVDFHKKPLPVGPQPEMKIAREALIAEVGTAGFRLAKEHPFLPYQYFLVFQAAGARTAGMVLYNGNILTVNDRQPRAEAVAASGGKIVFVGSTADAKKYIGPKAESISKGINLAGA